MSAPGPSRLAALLVAIGMYAPTTRADAYIETDGPDFVESSQAVGKGRFQFEAGMAKERGRRDNGIRKTLSTPTLLRFGMTESVEARLETQGRLREALDVAGSEIQSVRSGNGDFALGLKWHSQDADGAAGKPAISWIYHLDTPTGSDGFRGRGVRPSLRSVITWEMPADLSLGLMPGMKYDAGANGHRFTSGILGAVLGKRWPGNFRTFVETSATQIARAHDGGVLLSWDVGAAYLVNNDWQIGARIAVGANRNTPNNLFLLSLAGRF